MCHIGTVHVLDCICLVSVDVEFFIIDIDAQYNAILGRNWLGAMRAVASLYHQKLKFPSSNGVVEVRGSQQKARYCLDLAV